MRLCVWFFPDSHCIMFNIKKMMIRFIFFVLAKKQPNLSYTIKWCSLYIEAIWCIKWYVESLPERVHTAFSHIHLWNPMWKMWNATGVVCSIPLSNLISNHGTRNLSCIVGKSSVWISALCERERRKKSEIWLAHNKFHLKGYWTVDVCNGPSNLGYV